MGDRVNVVPLIALSKAGKQYTYGVPDRLRDILMPGMLVTIPFRGKKVAGVVTDLQGSAELDRVLDIVGVDDSQPVLLAHQLELARWIAVEYAAPLSDVLGIMLPPVLKHPSRGARIRAPVMAAEITEAGKSTLLSADDLKRAPAQRALLTQIAAAAAPASLSSILGGRTAPNAPLKALMAAGLVTLVPVNGAGSAESGAGAQPAEQPKLLSLAQKEAVHSIIHTLPPASLSKARQPKPIEPAVFLLHGVTGSGKTEVYMAVIAEALRRGRDALVMVPEISLTPQALERFNCRFPGLVASTHSRMADGERHREWRRIRSGEARIAVGPRSAAFTPLRNLGVIIVDEEHDASYKQDESPRYHARDVAVHLGRMLNIPVVLGSATPDVASYYRARKGSYHLLLLPDRPVWQPDQNTNEAPAEPAARPMPSVQIVDLRQELKAGHRDIFSRRLLIELEATLAQNQQALLFLNRRGAATSVVCRDCGYVALCHSCDLPLTYHSTAARLICHRCDRREHAPRRCPTCGSERIRYLGVGTQRVVDEAQRLFPQARVLRWDRDVTSRKGSHERIASTFARQEADILVGTQMVAKGLDFPMVTLVGVIVADVGVNLPDFRAAERTFQLMTQVAGRAGRADLPSQVIIQAYNPDHYAIKAAKDHDYWSFYRQEMTFRHASGYPPYSRLVRFVIRGRDDGEVSRQAHKLRDTLALANGRTATDSFELIGPAPAFTARVNGVFQWHLLARGDDVHSLLVSVPDDVMVDVDPVDLL